MEMVKSEYQVDESYIHLEEDSGGFGNPRCRYTILFAILIIAITTLPIWLSVIIPETIAFVNTAIILFFSAVWLSIAVNASINFARMQAQSNVPLRCLPAARKRKFKHIVVIPCYVDPLEVLYDCVGTLLMQGDVDSLVVVVAFEAKTPLLEDKIHSVKTSFGPLFKHLLVSVHTLDKSREIAGACSNKNYGVRSGYKYLVEEGLLKSHAVTVTTCDSDSQFHPNHFAALENAYNNENPYFNAPPRMCVWQPPLFYNWDLDQRPFFVRVTGIMRSFMMLGGQIAFDLNPMSIFSYPLELGLKAGFINPRYGVDDIIAKVRWMCATNEQVPVLLLPVPAISGPTIGTSFTMEVKEWSRQIRRWIVGSSETFHYFLIHWRGRPMFAGLWWFFMFFMYYAVLLCCAGLFTVLAGIPLPWVHYPTVSLGVFGKLSLKHIGLVALAVQYFSFGIAFVIDRLAVRMMTVQEDLSILRNIAHWLSSPFVLLQYSVIVFGAIMKFVFVGKGMAKHDMAAKEGFSASSAKAVTTTGASLSPPPATETVSPMGSLEPSVLLSSSVASSCILEDVEYDEEIIPASYTRRMRSTSVSMDVTARNSTPNDVGIRLSVFSNASKIDEQPTRELICNLPKKFRFGSYELDVEEHITQRRVQDRQQQRV
jgi:hypothetical protein